MRLCQSASDFPGIFRLPILWLLRVIHYITQQLAAVDLPWRTQVGPGFHLTHGWGFVINQGATVGGNVTIYHGTTIGQKDTISISGRISLYPTIEDEVWIGPHAVIAGGVVVGRGSRIAPGTIVTGDVEPYSIVGGNPMRIIKTGAPPDVLNPANLDAKESREKVIVD
jgi:serine O-acetyltransferase